MNSAEYVSVLVSIVIGLALADVLSSLHRLLRARRRVRWDWAAPLAALLIVFLLVMMWWSFYQPTAVPMTIGRFLPDFVTLVILFLLAGAALPDEVPAEGLSLRDYYEGNGRYFWGLASALLGWLLLCESVAAAVARTPLWPFIDANLADVAILLVIVSLAVVRRRWWHAVGFVILATGPIGWISRSLG